MNDVVQVEVQDVALALPLRNLLRLLRTRVHNLRVLAPEKCKEASHAHCGGRPCTGSAMGQGWAVPASRAAAAAAAGLASAGASGLTFNMSL